MKRTINILITVIISLMSFSAYADDHQQYFEAFAKTENNKYYYATPFMLKAMQNQYLQSNKWGNISIQTSQLTSLEYLTTVSQTEKDQIMKIVNQIRKDKKLETLAKKIDKRSSNDIFAQLSKDGKFITNLLVVVTLEQDQSLNVIYMEGQIPIESLKYSSFNYQ